jgi:hypothetical protein
MMERQTFWAIFGALDLRARPSHDCLDYANTCLDCPYVESIQTIREAASAWLTTAVTVAAA